MQLIQLLLPLYTNQKELFPEEIFIGIQKELAEKFGGITTYTRAPATGLWKETEDKTVKDAIIIYEVMAEEIDKNWWQSYKTKLEELFKQDEILIRSWKVQVF